MKKTILIGCVLVVFMLVAISMATAVSNEKITEIKESIKPCSTYNNITFKIVTDKKEYKVREPVYISLQLTNNGDKHVNITCPDGRTHDFLVFTDMFWHKRFQRSEGYGYGQVVTDIPIPPGKTVFWNQTWDQKGRVFQMLPSIFNHQVRPGYYHIMGLIPQLVTLDSEKTYSTLAYTSILITK